MHEVDLADAAQSHTFTSDELGVLRRVVTEAPVATALFDGQMRYLAASAPWCDGCGAPLEALLGRISYDVTPTAARFKAVHDRCLLGAAEVHVAEVHLPTRPEGIWAQWEMQPWRTRDGSVGGLIIRVNDITRQREEQAELTARERQLQVALDASNAGTWKLNWGTGELLWDQRSRDMFGVAASEAPTLEGVLPLVHEIDRERVRATLNAVRDLPVDRDWGEEFRIRRRDGTVRWIYARGRPERNDSGDVVGLVGINLDTTERREAEGAAADSDRQARFALEAASAFAWSWEADKPLILKDDVGARYLGIPADQPFDGFAFMRRIHPEDQEGVRATMAAARAQNGLPGWEMEYRYVRPDGREIWFHSRGAAVRDADGRATRLFGIMLDVTDRKRAELELARAHDALREHTHELERQTAQLRRLASELTSAEQRTRERLAKTLHDHLQQLLFSALMKVERAHLHSPDLDLLGQVHRELKDAIEETRTLSVDLLPSTLRRGDLPAALAWLGSWVHRQYGLTVATSVDPRANPVREDVRFLLFEAVRELLFNAVKHAAVDSVELALAFDHEGRVRITVSDRGRGFDPSILATGDTDSGGLGLFGIRERLALLGGRLIIDSAPGQGARFTIVMSGATATHAAGTGARVPASVADPAAPSADDKALRILLVDDHIAVREALRDVLAERPRLLVVGEAGDGIEAVEKAQSLAPDVIIMDVSMPRMDGLEATRRIRGLLPHVRIYGLSTQEESDKLHAIEEAGADGYFSKGIGVERLIDRLLEQAGKGRQAP
ncbi:MAG: PAS domain-containing protein [Vicinamibacterales bacterium]